MVSGRLRHGANMVTAWCWYGLGSAGYGVGVAVAWCWYGVDVVVESFGVGSV